jgi:hypothetical protein
MCLAAVNDYDLDHDLVRFPRFVQEPRELYEAMRFPEAVSWKRFSAAFAKVADREQVHEWEEGAAR